MLSGSPGVETPCDSPALDAEVSASVSKEPTTASQCQPEGQLRVLALRTVGGSYGHMCPADPFEILAVQEVSSRPPAL